MTIARRLDKVAGSLTPWEAPVLWPDAVARALRAFA